ncbi:MAG: hypothetical protein K8R87_07025 [Verrucomicrobia bacterium]|nr:hypothetical protein [Verrucomicrobiota bacterium]
MSTRFPVRRPQPASAVPVDIRLHAPLPNAEGAGGLAWVQWLFQSVRAQRTALIFQTDAVERVQALVDWQRFTESIFLPVLAPALLRGWRSAQQGDDAALAVCDKELNSSLPSALAERSIAGGAILLDQTRGAKYQAALGRFRVRVDDGTSPGHLAMVWSAVAVLFQIPPLDLLSEYLREEWIVATQHCPHHEVPQGPLGFLGLSTKALHAAGIHGDFSVVGESGSLSQT